MTEEISGTAIVKRIDETLMERQETRANLSKGTGLLASTISNWSIRNSVPRVDDIMKIADYLNVSVDWLVYGHEGKDLTTEERKVLKLFNCLDDTEKSFFISQLMLYMDTKES